VDGLAAIAAAITSKVAVDLAPLTAEVKRMADAQYVGEGADEKGIAQVTADGNAQVDSVIHEDSTGQMRVQVNADMP
jgi:hypothetical protein